MNVNTQLDFMQIGFDPGFENLVALFLLLPVNPYLDAFKKKSEVILIQSIFLHSEMPS